ncbi:MAG: GNAT family N-acetyltransferase [Bacteroidaceae bacterium]|nr:GNAT family N-acetyltransferase [Bacteroidaceae bacterium]
MDNIVCFREFEERDIDFIYQCKNDEKLNHLIVGQYHPFTKEEATRWLHGCMGQHDTYKFWAVCTNDDKKRIVGWISLSNIDKTNQSACFHGIVIGDHSFQDGCACIECFLFLYHYVFIECGLNRLYGSCLNENKSSLCMTEAMLNTIEGVARKSVYKNGRFYDVIHSAILRDDYLEYMRQDEFTMKKIVKRLLESKRTYEQRFKSSLMSVIS